MCLMFFMALTLRPLIVYAWSVTIILFKYLNGAIKMIPFPLNSPFGKSTILWNLYLQSLCKLLLFFCFLQ